MRAMEAKEKMYHWYISPEKLSGTYKAIQIQVGYVNKKGLFIVPMDV